MMNSGLSASDVAVLTGNTGRNNDGFGGDGGWAWWIIILLIFGYGGWGFGGGYGGGGANSPGLQGLATRADINEGFALNNITSGITAIQQGICSLGYDQLAQMNGINQNISQTGFGIQNAIQQDTIANMQNTNALSTQLANCCCETREAIQNVNFNMAQNTCALQNTMNNNTRDIIGSSEAGTRAILEKLGQMEYNSLQDKYQAMVAENQTLKFQASQSAQNQFIDAVGNNVIANLRQPTAVPAYMVPNPNAIYNYGCCNQNTCC